MIIPNEQMVLLKTYIENIEEIIAEDDVQVVLDTIDDAIFYQNKD